MKNAPIAFVERQKTALSATASSYEYSIRCVCPAGFYMRQSRSEFIYWIPILHPSLVTRMRQSAYSSGPETVNAPYLIWPKRYERGSYAQQLDGPIGLQPCPVDLHSHDG